MSALGQKTAEMRGRLASWWREQQTVLAAPPDAKKRRITPAENPDYWRSRAGGVNAYALRKGASDKITDAELRALWEDSSGRCYWCNETIALGKRRGGLRLATVDHVNPLSNAGPNVIGNLRWACESCNQARGSRHLAGVARAVSI